MIVTFKKTTLAVLLISTSTTFAGSMGPVCTAGNVTVPCATTAWDFGAQALYLNPIYGVGYGYLHGARISPNELRANERNMDWDWGFKLEGSYHFNTGNDLNVNWYHLKSESNQTLVGTFNAYRVTEFNSQGSVQTNLLWDAVNAEFGQHVDFGESKDIRFHAGVQYVRLKVSIPANYILFLGTPDATPASGYDEDSYTGFGPRIGADMTYNFVNGFSIYGNAATALLIGESKYRYSLTDINGTFIESGSKKAIVPEVEAKLGVKYAYLINPGDLIFDAGYMVNQYFEPFGYFQQTTKRQSDLGFHGPYLGVKWLGTL